MSYFIESVKFTRIVKKLIEENHRTKSLPSAGAKYCFVLKRQNDSNILGVIVISPISLRLEPYIRTGYLEISRLWIEPEHRLQNVFFLQEVVKYLQKYAKNIGLLAYVDTCLTEEIDTYQKGNFFLKGYAKQGHHYEKNSQFFHRKKIWREAKKLGISEAQHADALGLKRVIDKKKAVFEFVFKRNIETKGCIYKIEFANGKVYIGQTINGIKYRLQQHLSSARNGSTTQAVHNAIRKYKFQCTISELEKVPITDLSERENYWIQKYQSTNREYGYNNPLAPNYVALRLPEDVFFEAFRLRKNGLKYHEIEKVLGVAKGLINAVIWGRIRPEIRMKWLEENQDLEKQKELKDDQVLEIFKMYEDGLKASEIAKKLDVTKTYVSYVLHGKMRPELKKQYEQKTGRPLVYAHNRNVDLDVAQKVLKERYEHGKTNLEISAEYGLSPVQVSTIVTGKTAKAVSQEYIKDKTLEKTFIRDDVFLEAFDLVFKKFERADEVAKKLGVSKSMLSLIFNGHTRPEIKQQWEAVNGNVPSLKSIAQKRIMQDPSKRENLKSKFQGKSRKPGRTRPCTCSNGLEFPTVKAAAEHYGIHSNTVTWSLTHKEPIEAKGQSVTFSYVLNEHKNMPSKERAVKTSDNLVFKTISDAARHYGLDWSTVKHAIESQRPVGSVVFFYS